MSREIAFVGGRFDGLELRSGLGAPFLWTDGRRCFRAPARGRELYRLVGQASRGLVVYAMRYRFVGHTHGLCECGVYRERSGACGICGSKVLVG